jgi:hypothetical protein
LKVGTEIGTQLTRRGTIRRDQPRQASRHLQDHLSTLDATGIGIDKVTVRAHSGAKIRDVVNGDLAERLRLDDASGVDEAEDLPQAAERLTLCLLTALGQGCRCVHCHCPHRSPVPNKTKRPTV